ncbi:NAD(P)H dehydrogenase (quinone) [Pararobbsia alpina]|uniref:NmrA family NAD(P)-binding protein n=1 Tax=Pararobbsia alpina TaxID=621374 RepID=UPI0039A59E58
MSKKVLVSGATGATGLATVRESIALGLDVRAMVRAKDARSEALEKLGAEVVIGDYFDIDSICAATQGVEAAYYCYPVAPGLLNATVNFAQAARETGMKAVLYLSQRSINRNSTSHLCRDGYIAEQVLNWSRLPVIHLRPTMFLDWLLYPTQLRHLRQGILSMPVGKGRHSPIASSDQGRAIAALLKDPEEHIGTSIDLSGPVEMDHEQIAAELSKALGRKIVFQDASLDEYCTAAENAGMPPYLVNHFRGGLLDYRNGHMSGADNNIEKLTGRRPMTVGEFARAHADLLNGN